ncbi:MAG: replication-relaxation family protein [Polyangiaceae bacterium]
MTLSRYRRPARPGARLQLQGRDVEILRAARRHRFVQAEHLHALLFDGRTLRVTQARLRKLWEHRLLDRAFVPFSLDGERQPPSVASTPTYSLAPRGA